MENSPAPTVTVVKDQPDSYYGPLPTSRVQQQQQRQQQYQDTRHIAAAVATARVRLFERLMCVCVLGVLVFLGIVVWVLLPILVDQLTVCPMDYEISVVSLNCTQLYCCDDDAGQIKNNFNCSLDSG